MVAMLEGDIVTWTGEPPHARQKVSVDERIRFLSTVLGCKVIGAGGESPTLQYVNSDGSLGLARPALEPEVRMWLYLTRDMPTEECGDDGHHRL